MSTTKKLEPNNKNLFDLFTDDNFKFLVPKYQRVYKWKRSEIDTLWKDLFESFKRDRDKSYFLGPTVMCVSSNKQRTEHHVVDGQQRITTLFIMFNRFLCFLENNQFLKNTYSEEIYNKFEVSIDDLKIKIKKILFLNKKANPDLESLKRLELQSSDDDIFGEIITNINFIPGKPENNYSRLLKADYYIYLGMKEDLFNPETSLEYIKEFITFCLNEVRVIQIIAYDDNDAYLLFESLNYRGVDLSVMDLLKNEILRKTPKEKIKRIDTSWDLMISNIKLSKFNATDFLLFFWSALGNTNTTSKVLYKEIKDKFRYLSFEEIQADFLTPMFESSEYFSQITNSEKFYGVKLNESEKKFREITYLGYRVAFPLFLRLKLLKIEDEQFLNELTHNLTSFLFRNITIGESRPKKAKDLINIIMKYLDKPKDSLIDEFDNSITRIPILSEDSKLIEKNFNLHKSEINKIISKENALKTEDFTDIITVNSFSNKIGKYYLLKCFELTNPETDIKSPQLEHILPRGFKDTWDLKQTKYSEVKLKIEKIGNLTIIKDSLNNKIKNKPFKEKVKIYNKSQIDMNKNIQSHIDSNTTNLDLEWFKKGIDNRGKKLSELGAKIWNFI